MIDFIVLHTYPLWDADFSDYRAGDLNFQVDCSFTTEHSRVDLYDSLLG